MSAAILKGVQHFYFQTLLKCSAVAFHSTSIDKTLSHFSSDQFYSL